MRVWTKPELIVDTMVLSQFCLNGCEVKSGYNYTENKWVYTFMRSSDNQETTSVSFSFEELMTAGGSRDFENNTYVKLDADEILSYAKSNKGLFKKYDAVTSGAVAAKLQDS